MSKTNPGSTEKVFELVKSYIQRNSSKKIVAIAGPTATGKSDLSIDLCKNFGGYILNGDSRQLYKEMRIGTAQPIPDKLFSNGSTISENFWEIQGVKHFLYGQKSIFNSYTLFQYQKDANEIIASNNEPCFIVGGTGLYIDSVIFNYQLEQEEIDSNMGKLIKLPISSLQEMLGEKINILNESDRKNPHRLIRLIQRNGKKYLKSKPKDHLYIALIPEKFTLEKNIKTRIGIMFNNGLLEENIQIRKLIKEHFYSLSTKDITAENQDIKSSFTDPFALKSIGYQEFNDYFDNKISLEEVKEQIFINSCKYAKRQITWFKKIKSGQYFLVPIE